MHQLSERQTGYITHQLSQDDVAPARIPPLTAGYTGHGDGRSECRRLMPGSPACSKWMDALTFPTLCSFNLAYGRLLSDSRMRAKFVTGARD